MLQISINDNQALSISNEDNQWLMDGNKVEWDASQLSNGLISILYNGKSFTATVEKIDTDSKEITLNVNGQVYKTKIKEPIDQLLSSMGMELNKTHKIESVKAPMPGMILKILVEPGQVISKGDGMVVLEAMKMENTLKSAGNATVKAIKVNERMAVEKGAVLIELE